jgi:hypothetical protein
LDPATALDARAPVLQRRVLESVLEHRGHASSYSMAPRAWQPAPSRPRNQSSLGLISGPAPRSDQTTAAKGSTPPAGKLRWGGPSLAAAATACSACSIQRFFDSSLACCAVALCARPLTARPALSVRPAVRSLVHGEGCAGLPAKSLLAGAPCVSSYRCRNTAALPCRSRREPTTNMESGINCLPLC